jgi:hypothetical protein
MLENIMRFAGPWCTTQHVPSFKFNLFSGTTACKGGASIYAKGTTLTVVYKGRTVLTADADNGLFVARARVQHVKKVSEDSMHATALSVRGDPKHSKIIAKNRQFADFVPICN